MCRYVTDLIKFGAVHYSLECPTPPASASAEQLELYNRVLQFRAARKKERASLKGKTLREAQKTHRITSGKEHVEAGTYLRVHVHPKRFPRYPLDHKGFFYLCLQKDGACLLLICSLINLSYIVESEFCVLYVEFLECRVYEVDWPSRVIAETDSFVVLDKPAGVSVGYSKLITMRTHRCL